jgi:protein-L-isoaspartate(D-aspartate) O-methyltransferase
MTDSYAEFYAELVTATAGLRDAAIRSAFANTDRARFLGPGPWRVYTPIGYVATPGDHPALVYQDVVFALAPERSINNGEPSLHARCLGAVGVRLGEQVLHVGAGTGYYTAILAALAGPAGHVAAYEIESDLAATAAANLAALS